MCASVQRVLRSARKKKSVEDAAATDRFEVNASLIDSGNMRAYNGVQLDAKGGVIMKRTLGLGHKMFSAPPAGSS